MKKTTTIFAMAILLLFTSCKDESKIKSDASHAETMKNHDDCAKASSRASNLLSKSNEGTVIDSEDSVDSINSETIVENKMVEIPSGTFMMGSNGDEWSLSRELPQHEVTVDAFYMDETEVTNAQFSKFVQETGYITLAEKDVDWEELKKQAPAGTPKPSDDILKAGSMVFVAPDKVDNLTDFSQWWQWMHGADWKHPTGPDSSIEDKENHPVIHIAYVDALAYAKWIKKRLPTEAEWEWAARGGLNNQSYPWGNQHVEDGKPKCNFWTGTFPTENTKEDGFYYTAPVKSYEPNGFGLYDMSGNVWELCADWLDINHYKNAKNHNPNNPKGPQNYNYPPEPYSPKRVIRGGSFLCNDSYCASYRVSARMPASEDTGMNHLGFRLVKDVN